MDPSELVALIATLNPENTPGRLAVIVRMGAAKLREKLPALIEAVSQAGQVVAWVCDPMHGNTEEVQGFKTRRYDNIRAEVGLRGGWVLGWYWVAVGRLGSVSWGELQAWSVGSAAACTALPAGGEAPCSSPPITG